MQIGLAETQMMHGGAELVDMGFTLCTFFCATLQPTRTHACIALWLTFSPYPCVSLSLIRRILTKALREGVVCDVSMGFDSSRVVALSLTVVCTE